MFFFFKQKTAYEMRISDWSSDVCSSDLQLDDCLASLHYQTLPRDRYDIIVVDNGSTGFETGRQDVSRRYPDVRMVSDREIGTGPVRNVGDGLAETAMIPCGAADCIAERRWLESARAEARRIGDTGV